MNITDLNKIIAKATKQPWKLVSYTADGYFFESYVRKDTDDGELSIADLMDAVKSEKMDHLEAQANGELIVVSRSALPHALKVIEGMKAALESVSNQLQISSMARAGDPTQQADMKMEAVWAGKLEQALALCASFERDVTGGEKNG